MSQIQIECEPADRSMPRRDSAAPDILLLSGRAAIVPASRTLLVADLHLGKAESFQCQGIPLPSDGDAATLNALLALGTLLCSDAEGGKVWLGAAQAAGLEGSVAALMQGKTEAAAREVLRVMQLH
jgi:hypothetical protein